MQLQFLSQIYLHDHVTAILCGSNLVDPLNAESGLFLSCDILKVNIPVPVPDPPKDIRQFNCFQMIIQRLQLVALLTGVFTLACNLWCCKRAFSEVQNWILHHDFHM